MSTFEKWLLLLSILHLFSLPKIIIKSLRRLEKLRVLVSSFYIY